MRKEHKWLWAAAAVAMAAGICMGCGAKSDGGKDQAAVQEEKGREESTEQAAASQNGGGGSKDHITFNISQRKGGSLSMHRGFYS